MRYYCFTLLLLSIPLTSAWVVPELSRKRQGFSSTSRLQAEGGDTKAKERKVESSRRTWFSQVAAAAVAVTTPVWTCPSIAHAKSTATVDAPSAKQSSRSTSTTNAAVCDTAVSVWKNPSNNRRVYILGTAHISSQSADVARDLVSSVKPDAVFVELDAKRVGRFDGAVVPDGTSSSEQQQMFQMTPSTTIATESSPVEQPTRQQSKPSFLPKLDLKQRALQAGSAAVGGAIQGMYKKLNSSGFNAGEEFVVAIQEGRKLGSSIVLGDRDVEVTLRRLTEALSQTDLQSLLNPDSELEKSMNELMPGKPPSPDMGDDEFRQEMSLYVETMKAKENVRRIMRELKKAAPAIYTALVEERDIYMGRGLDSINQFATTVAVMGIAHMEGVESTLQSLGWREEPAACPRV